MSRPRILQRTLRARPGLDFAVKLALTLLVLAVCVAVEHAPAPF